MEIVVPELGESIVEATVARWLKKEGEPVQVGEPVVELETDKVDLEVGAKSDGVLKQILHQEGDDVQVGAVLGIIEAGAGGEASGDDGQSAGEEARTPPPEAAPPAEAEEPSEDLPAEPHEPEQEGAAGRATPVARRMAEEAGLDLAKVTAAGERITKEDVQRYLAQQEKGPEQDTAVAAQPSERPSRTEGRTEEPAPKTAPPPPAADKPVQREAGRTEERIRMTRRRRTIASRLVEAQQTAAMLTTFNDVDMGKVMELRQRRQEDFQKRHGIKLGFMSFFVKAVVGALKSFPYLNAEIQGDEIVLKHYYDIGMAIGAEEGLVVPVLRSAGQMTFAEIELAIRSMIEKSQAGTLSLDDLRGGTFSITNGGVYGSLLSTPILNPPQVAILGLHRIEQRPTAVDGQVVIRPMMYLALSYDHRIVDGREAVQFLARVKELIEDPEQLLLEG
jgi:2-oxoglutarate dehydrogenase E2 component (dihydrolipoamide succinyltransferase)